MIENLEIRESADADALAIDRLYADAFPDEDLRPLVKDLQNDKQRVFCLVGIAHEQLAGHVAFTACRVIGQDHRLALLGPLAVASAWRRRGIGSALVRTGLQRLKGDGTVRVFVLGDPAYYSRFGFRRETGVVPPYPLAAEWLEAWQAIDLADRDSPPLQGALCLPLPWRREALWSP